MGIYHSRNVAVVGKAFDFPEYTVDKVKINDLDYQVINTPLMTAAPVDVVKLTRTVMMVMNERTPVNVAIKGQLSDVAYNALLEALKMPPKPRVEILGATIIKNDVPPYKITGGAGGLDLDAETPATTVDGVTNVVLSAMEEARKHLTVSVTAGDKLSDEQLEEVRKRVGARKVDHAGDLVMFTFGDE